MRSRMPHVRREKILQFVRSIPPEQGARIAHGLMYWAFLLCMLLFPFGHSFREAGSIIALISLVPYYYWNWSNSALRRFPLAWAWLVFFLLILVNTVHSVAPLESWDVMAPNLRQGFVFPLIAMECVRDGRDLKRFVLVFILATFAQGLDGMYQYTTGVDFIQGTAIYAGRLTGSMSTPRVGNYMAMALVPAMGLGFLLPCAWKSVLRWSVCLGLLFPGLFLLLFSQTRSGYLGFAVALAVLSVAVFRKVSMRSLAGLVLIVLVGGGLAMFFGPQRMHLEAVAQDPRWELWGLALDVFRAHPWFGAGVSAFNPAFNSMGLVAAINGQDIPHPHNVYLQLLCELGIVGFVAAMVALFGPLAWGYARIRKGIAAAADREQRLYWEMTAMIWGGYLAYLVTCISGHNFFRTWWLAFGMSLLGLFCGACIRRKHPFSLPEF